MRAQEQKISQLESQRAEELQQAKVDNAKLLTQLNEITKASSTSRALNALSTAPKNAKQQPSQTCQIDTSGKYDPPTKLSVAIDGKLIGSVDLDGQERGGLSFACEPGAHQFDFKVQLNGNSYSCSGRFMVEKGLVFIPAIHVEGGQATCSLIQRVQS